MREILFRGKTKDTGKWVQGYFVYAKSDFDSEELREADIIPHDTDRVYKGEYHVVFPCIPETIGQYTGLNDNNGKKIFEGDILHCVSQWDMAKMVVIFEDGEFRMVLADQYKNYIKGSGFYAIRCFSKEIIGNIHDNPEFLKGGENNGI